MGELRVAVGQGHRSPLVLASGCAGQCSLFKRCLGEVLLRSKPRHLLLSVFSACRCTQVQDAGPVGDELPNSAPGGV